MLKPLAANHICLGRGEQKIIKLKKAQVLEWPAETYLHSGWQQRAVYRHCWQSSVLGIESSISYLIVYLVYAENNIIIYQKESVKH